MNDDKRVIRPASWQDGRSAEPDEATMYDEPRPEEAEDNARHRRRGIYLLPNLFTTGGLFAGFYAIIAAMAGHYELASIAVFIAMLMDGLDGRVARLTHTESAFGEQYDSIADMVSFGLAPALVMYQWALHGLNEYGWMWAKVGWLAAFVYAAAGGLRLARFNARVHVVDKRYFQGLPIPSGAGLVAGGVWLGQSFGINGESVMFPALVLTVCAGLLMVSSIPYYSFKGLNLRGRVPFTYILVVPLIFIFIALSPPKTLFGVFLAYSLSGPILWLWRFYRRRRIARRLDERRD
ncbi:MAG TPA: phosphatidylcholine/phosphatidylserine synthase [Gammaproteobacteria bacterium]|nr:phosphatidylcholine/phosphatidylserine synthase [Gammaproteobacteria bacterium]